MASQLRFVVSKKNILRNTQDTLRINTISTASQLQSGTEIYCIVISDMRQEFSKFSGFSRQVGLGIVSGTLTIVDTCLG